MIKECLLKSEYNRLLRRYYEVVEYFKDKGIAREKEEKNKLELNQVSSRLSEILVELRNYTDDEATRRCCTKHAYIPKFNNTMI
jgi:hypothetical protein